MGQELIIWKQKKTLLFLTDFKKGGSLFHCIFLMVFTPELRHL